MGKRKKETINNLKLTLAPPPATAAPPPPPGAEPVDCAPVEVGVEEMKRYTVADMRDGEEGWVELTKGHYGSMSVRWYNGSFGINKHRQLFMRDDLWVRQERPSRAQWNYFSRGLGVLFEERDDKYVDENPYVKIRRCGEGVEVLNMPLSVKDETRDFDEIVVRKENDKDRWLPVCELRWTPFAEKYAKEAAALQAEEEARQADEEQSCEDKVDKVADLVAQLQDAIKE